MLPQSSEKDELVGWPLGTTGRAPLYLDRPGCYPPQGPHCLPQGSLALWHLRQRMESCVQILGKHAKSKQSEKVPSLALKKF